METSSKFIWAWVLMGLGLGGMLIGLLLTSIVFGACLGVPLMLVSFPLEIIGIIFFYQAQNQKLQETISTGVKEGIQSQHQNVQKTIAAGVKEGMIHDEEKSKSD